MCFRPPSFDAMMKTCPKCGGFNAPELVKCKKCGADLPEIDTAAPEGGAPAIGAPMGGGAPKIPGGPKAPGAPQPPSAPRSPSAPK